MQHKSFAGYKAITQTRGNDFKIKLKSVKYKSRKASNMCLVHIMSCEANGQLARNPRCHPFRLAAKEIETPLIYEIFLSLMTSLG